MKNFNKLMLLMLLVLPLMGCHDEDDDGDKGIVLTSSRVDNFQTNSITTPEPTSLALLGSGLIFALKNRRRLTKCQK